VKGPSAELPPRLIDTDPAGAGDSEAAALLKRFDRHAPQTPPEEAVWNRTLARLMREGRRHRFRLVFATSCGILLGAAGMQAYLGLRAHSPANTAQTVPASSRREAGPVLGAGEASGPALAAQPPPILPPSEAGKATDAGGAMAPPGVAAAPAVRSAREAERVPNDGAGEARSPPVAADRPAVLSPREAGKGLGRGAAPAVSQPSLDPPRIRLAANATALPRGPSELIGEAELVLSAEGTAWATAQPHAVVVDLDAGRISLHVEKRPTQVGRRFDVRAGGYRFTVLGTRFEVARLEGGVRLSVSEGSVGVFRGEASVTTVVAGGEWSSEGAASAGGATAAMASPTVSAPTQLPSPSSSPSSPLSLPQPPTTAPPPLEPPALPSQPPSQPLATPPPTAPSPTMARPTPGSSCVPGARGDVRQLLNCYLNEARGAGLTAEVALYEAARLRRDNLTDLSGALELLREHRRRFPSGTLAYEVRLSMAELLPKLARYREALTDIDWLLDAPAGIERRGELLLLRGHVLREGFENWSGAERAYAQAADVRGGDGRAADPALFWRAVCLESLGRKDEARRAYAAYLARPHPSLREQAELRLRALEHEHAPLGKAQSR
jgi:hypothetical protein